jgi:hypothetical protein
VISLADGGSELALEHVERRLFQKHYGKILISCQLALMEVVKPCSSTAEVERATLWFMKHDSRFTDEKPYLFTYPVDDGTYPSNLKYEPRDGVVLRNLRDHIPPYEESGIAVLTVKTEFEHNDYDDVEKVERSLLPKLREALRAFLGADIVNILEYKV